MIRLKEETVKSGINFPANLESLPKILDFICSNASKNGVPDPMIKKIELASEEAVVNVINHAYSDLPQGNIEIQCEGNGKSFSIHIIDGGVAFDPVDKEIDIKKDQPIEKRKVGGLGIYLIRELMDEVTYYRNDNKNHLMMTVRF